MADGRFFVHKLNNGVTVVGEMMDYVSSAAFSFLVPLGSATDPLGIEGASSILAEMFNRGAGEWNSRALSEQFEEIGAHRSHSSGIEVSLFSGLLLGENLPRALSIYRKVLLEPRLPDDELEPVRSLILQELYGIEDEPSAKVMIELAKRFYPNPFGRPQSGTIEGVKAVTLPALKEYYRNNFSAERSIIGLAGKFNRDEILKLLEREFGGWSGSTPVLPAKPLATMSSSHHLEQDTNQLQLALAYPSVSVEHPDYYVARVLAGILSGGMAGRLFIEVREKRGLVYRVSASHSAAKGRAAIFVYAGTTPERAEETLHVTLTELRKIKDGVSEEELIRAKNDLKSRLVMQGESTSMRASAIVNDWWNLKRLRELGEIKDAIDRVSADDIVRHSIEFPPGPITLVTLGPKPLVLH